MKMKDLALAQVRRGERFTLDGVEFVKLEDDMDAAFAVAADTLPECCQFEDDDAEREDHNNYAGSLLSKTVERWLRDKHPAIFSAVVERPIDLTTMDGMTAVSYTHLRFRDCRHSHSGHLHHRLRRGLGS